MVTEGGLRGRVVRGGISGVACRRSRAEAGRPGSRTSIPFVFVGPVRAGLGWAVFQAADSLYRGSR